MESGYSFNEFAVMHLVLGECRGCATADARRYRQKYLNQRVPNCHTFPFVDH